MLTMVSFHIHRKLLFFNVLTISFVLMDCGVGDKG